MNLEKLIEEEKLKIKKDYLDLYKNQNDYLSPQVQKIVDQLVEMYENDEKNPITFAKQLDLIFTTVLDQIALKFMNKEDEDKAKDFLKVVIQTLIKSLNIYLKSIK